MPSYGSPLVYNAASRFIQQPSAAAKVARKAMSLATGASPGLGGFVGAMTQSSDAAASVLDVTQTEGYQRSAKAIAAGLGHTADISNWNPLGGSMVPPTHDESMAAYNAKQKSVDDMFLRAGQPTPRDQLLLNRFNRFNPRANSR